MTKDEFVYDLLCATGFDGPGYMHPLEQPRPKRRPVKAGDSDIFWSYKVKDVTESILPKETEDEADCVRKMLAVELTYEKVDANIRRRFYEAGLLWEKLWKQSDPKPATKKAKAALSALEKKVRTAFDEALLSLGEALRTTLATIQVPAVLHGDPVTAYTTEIARQLGIFGSGSLKTLDKPAEYHSDDSIDMTNGERYEYLLRLLYESIKGLYEQNGVQGLHYAFVSTAAHRREICTDSFAQMNVILENAPSIYMDRHIADSAWIHSKDDLRSLCSEMQSRATNMPDAPQVKMSSGAEEAIDTPTTPVRNDEPESKPARPKKLRIPPDIPDTLKDCLLSYQRGCHIEYRLGNSTTQYEITSPKAWGIIIQLIKECDKADGSALPKGWQGAFSARRKSGNQKRDVVTFRENVIRNCKKGRWRLRLRPGEA